MGEAKLSEVPVLIFANKQDIQMSLSAEEVMELMELNNIMNRMWSIFACSAVKGEGIFSYYKIQLPCYDNIYIFIFLFIYIISIIYF